MSTLQLGKTANTTAVIYLARCAEGQDAFRRFLESYRNHDAGASHDLVVIYKGFEQSTKLLQARELFSKVAHVGIEVDDSGFDIGSYLTIARQIDNEFVCFLNTFTEISAGGWLAKLQKYVTLPRVGLVGAMGSYESLQDTIQMMHKLGWECNVAKIPYDEAIEYYYDYIISSVAYEHWRSRKSNRSRSRPRLGLLRHIRRLVSDHRFRQHWQALLAPGGSLNEYAAFPPFPNPHVRSNGFVISRQRFLQHGPRRIEGKLEACAFESGEGSLTRSLRRLGMATLTVGRDGVGYDVAGWPRSSMFRIEDQANLLLTDNQSRKFHTMLPGERMTHVRVTWGDYLHRPPPDYPSLGLHFAAKPWSAAWTAEAGQWESGLKDHAADKGSRSRVRRSASDL